MADHKLDQVGRWTEIKLEIVRDYSSAYTKILSNQKAIRRVVYIDAFAGAGMHISKQTKEFIPGSPANALNVQPPFDEFHFIDRDKTRVRLLDELAATKPNVHVYHEDCNQILVDKIFPRCRYEDYARGLCLLDPYKICVNWDVLAAAGKTESIEVFYNFMIMDANMNILLKNPEKVPDEQAQRMNAAWGDDSWRGIAYHKPKGRLFDMEEKAPNEVVAEAFRERLRTVAGFEYVPKPIAMKNSTGAVVYYLYFASPNKTGHKIVDHIFKKYGG